MGAHSKGAVADYVFVIDCDAMESAGREIARTRKGEYLIQGDVAMEYVSDFGAGDSEMASSFAGVFKVLLGRQRKLRYKLSPSHQVPR